MASYCGRLIQLHRSTLFGQEGALDGILKGLKDGWFVMQPLEERILAIALLSTKAVAQHW